MYDPTRFEARKHNDHVSRICRNCGEEFTQVQSAPFNYCCSATCAIEYDELGPYEPRCIDFDAEDNM